MGACRLVHIVLLLACAEAAQLELKGADSDISMNGAVLTATCDGTKSSPLVILAHPTDSQWASFYASGAASNTSVRLFIRGVPTSCIHSTTLATEPCHAHDTHVPPLWHCTFAYADGAQSLTTGPYRTSMLSYGTHGDEIFLECPLPPTSQVAGIAAGYAFDGSSFNLTVGAAYGLAPAPLPFQGLPDSNIFSFVGFAPPPPAAPPSIPFPSMPPPSAPPMGVDAASAVSSCKYLSDNNISTSGRFWLNPTSAEPSDAYEVYCHLDAATDGGGWTMVSKGALGRDGDKSYNGMLDKSIDDREGFLKSYKQLPFKDILIMSGDCAWGGTTCYGWVSFHGVSDGSNHLHNFFSAQTFYVNSVQLQYSAKSPGYSMTEETDYLTFKNRGTAGDQDTSLWVLGDSGSGNMNDGTAQVLHSDVGMNMFRVEQDRSADWDTFTCSSGSVYHGFWGASDTEKTYDGGIFVR